MYSSIWDSNIYFFNVILLFKGVLCVLLKEKHKTLTWNLGKISFGEKQYSGPTEWTLMKSHFSVKFMWLFTKNGTCCEWQVFFFISEVFWRFFLTPTYYWLSLWNCLNHVLDCHFGSFWTDKFDKNYDRRRKKKWCKLYHKFM